MRLQTRVVFSESLKCFVDSETGQRFRGVTAALRLAYWSDYCFKTAKTDGTEGTGNNRYVKGPTASKRGSLVDQQIDRIIQGKPLDGKPHAFTVLAFKAFRAAALQPVASQVVVFDQERRLATAVDILCVNSERQHVVVELKCSSNFKYHAFSGPMKHEFSTLRNSIANQHAVQTLVTRALFERTYGAKAVAAVLKINQLGASWIPVPRPQLAMTPVLDRLSAKAKAASTQKSRGHTGRKGRKVAKPRLAARAKSMRAR